MQSNRVTREILGAVALVAMLGAAPPTNAQQVTFPPGTDCRKLAPSNQMKCKDTLTHPLENGNNGSPNNRATAPAASTGGSTDGSSSVNSTTTSGAASGSSRNTGTTGN